MSRTHHSDGSWTNHCEGREPTATGSRRCRRQCRSGSDAWEMHWRWEIDLAERHHEFCSEEHRDRYLAEHADQFAPELVQMASDNIARRDTN